MGVMGGMTAPSGAPCIAQLGLALSFSPTMAERDYLLHRQRQLLRNDPLRVALMFVAYLPVMLVGGQEARDLQLNKHAWRAIGVGCAGLAAA